MEKSLPHTALTGAALVFLYVALFDLSDWLVGTEAVRDTAGIIFLPAFIRLLGFLLIGYWVIPALFVAGLFCVDLGLGLGGKVVVSAFIAVGGPLGAFIAAKLSGLQPSLSNLTPMHLLLLSAFCSAGNAFFYHLGLHYAGVSGHSDFSTHLIVFAGDMIGTWAAIYFIKLSLEMFLKWRSNY